MSKKLLFGIILMVFSCISTSAQSNLTVELKKNGWGVKLIKSPFGLGLYT